MFLLCNVPTVVFFETSSKNRPIKKQTCIFHVQIPNRFGFLVEMDSKSQQHFLGCITATVLGYVLNVVFERCLPKNFLKPINGSPRYTFWISFGFQTFIFPMCFMLCVFYSSHMRISKETLTVSIWLNSHWHEIESMWISIFHYCFFGYLAKDMFIPMTLPLYAHHVVCMLLILSSLFEFPTPSSSAVFITITCVLELGSCALNLHHLFPTDQLLNHMSMIIMSVSNTGAALLALWYGLYFEHATTMLQRWLVPVVGGFLIASRQHLEWVRWKAQSIAATNS